MPARVFIGLAIAGAMCAAPPVPPCYLDASRQVVFQPAGASKPLHLGKGYDLSLSRDGKKLLFSRDVNSTSPNRDLFMVDASGKPAKILSGNVGSARWSPDASQIAFLRYNKQWDLYVMPAGKPDQAKKIRENVMNLLEWIGDGSAILSQDEQALHWISPVNGVDLKQIPLKKIYGEEYDWTSADVFRPNPRNPDLIAVSALRMDELKGAEQDEMYKTQNVFLYDVKTGKRTAIPSSKTYSQSPVWTADGEALWFVNLVNGKKPQIRWMKKDGSATTAICAGEEVAAP